MKVASVLLTAGADANKMSKSVGNVISPKDLVNKYGADIVRLWTALSDNQRAGLAQENHLAAGHAERAPAIALLFPEHVAGLEVRLAGLGDAHVAEVDKILATKEVAGMKHFFVEDDNQGNGKPFEGIETSINNVTTHILTYKTGILKQLKTRSIIPSLN